MARGTVIEVEGGARLTKTLRDAAADLDELQPLHADIAEVVATAARNRAPRGVTGRLASSGRSSGTKPGAVIRFGSRAVPYARPIHWGWPARHIAPHRFLWDAAQDTQPRWLGMYRDAVNRILAKVKGA